jgi:hypothetical protein
MRFGISREPLEEEDLERDKRIELSPPPWQGGVLPLYESRPGKRIECFYSTRLADRQVSRDLALLGWSGRLTRRRKIPRESINFEDTRCFHDRRFFLPLGEALGALAVDVHTRELLAIVIVNGDLPVAVLAAAISTKAPGPAELGLFSQVE